jgi:hypothetical protein
LSVVVAVPASVALPTERVDSPEVALLEDRSTYDLDEIRRRYRISRDVLAGIDALGLPAEAIALLVQPYRERHEWWSRRYRERRAELT